MGTTWYHSPSLEASAEILNESADGGSVPFDQLPEPGQDHPPLDQIIHRSSQLKHGTWANNALVATSPVMPLELVHPKQATAWQLNGTGVSLAPMHLDKHPPSHAEMPRVIRHTC